MNAGLPRIHYRDSGYRCPCGKRWRKDPRFPSEPRVRTSSIAERVTCWDCYAAAMDDRRAASKLAASAGKAGA